MPVGFEARSENGLLQGTCDVVDHFTGEQVRCLAVDTYPQVGNDVHIFGDALHGDDETRYHLHAIDNTESGIGTDVFGLQTQSGFAREGLLTEGNVQVHQR